MSDVLFLLLTAGFFLAASGLISGCERLSGVEPGDADLLADPDDVGDAEPGLAASSAEAVAR